jgi:phospholipid/cholesterol/gamma-HCH transport system permease protein
LNILAHIGRATLALLEEIGRVSLFLKDALIQGLTPKIFLRQILEQILRIGYFSLPVVGLTAFFTGGALALQIYRSAAPVTTRKASCRQIVALGITRELGPVHGRPDGDGPGGGGDRGGTWHHAVTEQIDALTTLSTNPFKYLVAPRIVAASC